MKTIKTLLNKCRIITTFSLLSSLLFVAKDSFATSNKMETEFGFYSLTASSGTKSGNVSTFGIYRIGYRRSVTSNFDLGSGYTIMYSKIITGDSGFGLDVNGSYYPLGASHLIEAQNSNSYLAYSEDLRPLISLSFSQRNYQSIQTSYAGFGGAIGVEKYLSNKLNARVSARYNMLSAGNNATAKEFSFNTGIVIEF